MHRGCDQKKTTGNMCVLRQACLFVMTSPDEYNISETLSTLQFGANAQQVALGQAKKNITKGPPVANWPYLHVHEEDS